MNPAPECSVCIANYNGAETIEECLDSVLAQRCDFPFEVIVHDDASADGSLALVRARYPGVRVIESKENVGFCVSNNRMAAAAQGRHLLLLNNDAALRPGALAALHAAAQAAGGPAVLGIPQFDRASGALLDRGSLYDPFLNPLPNLDPRRPEVAMIMGACLWLPRALWDEIGGFPDWFESLAEDMYLCCAARNLGHPVRVLDASGYDHWVGRSLGGGKVRDDRLVTTFRRRALSERNKTYVMVIFYPRALLLAVLPLHLLLLAAEGATLSVLGRDRRFWTRIYGPCLSALWRNRSRLRHERARAQARRRIGLAAFLAVFTWMPHKLRMAARHGLPRVS